MPVLAWRSETERGPDLQIAGRAPCTLVRPSCVLSLLLPSVTKEREANPKAANQLLDQDSIKQIHGTRNPCYIAWGGFLSFAFGILEAGSSSIVCRISSARCGEQPLQPLFSIIYVGLLDTGALFLPVRSNLCHLFTLAHPRSAFSLTRKARPQIVILALREPQLILLPIEPLRTATPLHKRLD